MEHSYSMSVECVGENHQYQAGVEDEPRAFFMGSLPHVLKASKYSSKPDPRCIPGCGKVPIEINDLLDLPTKYIVFFEFPWYLSCAF